MSTRFIILFMTIAMFSTIGCSNSSSKSQDPLSIPVSGVTVKSSTSLVVGATEQLTESILPADATDKDVSWSSDTESIVTVSEEGLITGKAAGSAKITVTTDDGEKTAICNVTVIPATVPTKWPISGNINLLDNNILNSSSPYKFSGEIDFGSNPYDDSDFDSLSSGGKKLITDLNLGGTRTLSEVFAYEVLRNTIGAQLLKSEMEISYTINGKTTDFLIQVDNHKIGVVVIRGYINPPDSDYTVTAAQTLLTNKLSQINESTANVTSADSWEKQILFIMAYSSSIATSFDTAWANIDNATKRNTILIITTTNGDDSFMY